MPRYTFTINDGSSPTEAELVDDAEARMNAIHMGGELLQEATGPLDCEIQVTDATGRPIVTVGFRVA